MVLKIAILSSGVVLADGQAIELDRLDEMLQKLKAEGGAVWYYREQSANPEAIGMRVIELAVKHKLPIRLSTKADYSDEVDPKTASRASANAPRMPDVVVREDIQQVFVS